jgi:hypothetical protein
VVFSVRVEFSKAPAAKRQLKHSGIYQISKMSSTLFLIPLPVLRYILSER